MAIQVIPLVTSTVAPTASETVAAGYPLGQKWFNIVTGIEYLHKSTGVWVEIIKQGTEKVLINTTTDNGVDKLQVNGSISGTNYTGSATLTGTPTAPTATAGTNTTQIATTAFVQSELTIVNSDFLLYSMSF